MATDQQLDREDVIRELRRVAKGLDRHHDLRAFFRGLKSQHSSG